MLLLIAVKKVIKHNDLIIASVVLCVIKGLWVCIISKVKKKKRFSFDLS